MPHETNNAIVYYNIKNIKDFETVDKYLLYSNTFNIWRQKAGFSKSVEFSETLMKIILASIKMAYFFQYQEEKRKQSYNIKEELKIYIDFKSINNQFQIVVAKILKNGKIDLDESEKNLIRSIIHLC